MTAGVSKDHFTISAGASGAQAVIASLEANGVDTVFGIPGVHTLALYDALRSSSIRHVLARHEQGVGFMADGYARASGRPGVAFVITGPGVTNVATAVGQAYTDSSPVLVISSNVERSYVDDMRGSLHDLRSQLGVMAAVTKWNGRAMNASEVPGLMRMAFEQLNSGRPLPVHVEIPLDVLDDPSPVEAREPVVERYSPAANRESVDAAARMLARSQRPVVFCGGGAVSSGATQHIVALAELLQAPVVTSIMGKGAIPENHPLAIGTNWSSGNAVDDLIQQSDCLLVIGSKLGWQGTHGFTLSLPSPLIRIEIDPREMTLNARPDLPLLGDAALTTEALVAAIRDEGPPTCGYDADTLARTRKSSEATAWHAERRQYVDALREAIPGDGVLATDMTQLAYVACYLYPVYEPRTFFFPSGYGTLGFALPVAIGAKVARPEATVVAVAGDGGFQYTMAELGCAVQERLGLPIVIFNDSTYSAVKEAQAESRGGRYIGVDLVNPDYVALAAAYGIPGVRVDSPERLVREIRLAAERDLPTLIDVPIAPWV